MRANPTGLSAPAREELLNQLAALLQGGQAHAGFDQVVAAFPPALQGTVPEGLPYSAWQLIEHLRLAQHDILLFSVPPTGGYQPMQWPEDYWPKEPAPPSGAAWEETLLAIRRDRDAFEAVLRRPEADLFKPFRWGEGQNLLREALLIADHASYHLGELVVLRRLLGLWKT